MHSSRLARWKTVIMVFHPIPEISVIITIYREGSLLPKTIDSVLAQSFEDFEIILVDNNADHETRHSAETYVKQYPEKIRIVHESVQGICSAKNRGIYESRGKFIAFLDGDDLMARDRLALQREVLLNHPEISLVTCLYDIISFDGKNTIEKNVQGPTIQSALWQDLEKAFSCLYPAHVYENKISSFRLTIPSTFFISKDRIIEAGLFDMRLNPRWCEDYEIQTRLYTFGRFHQIQEPLISYRSPSLESKTIKEKQISGFERFWQDQRFFTILYENFSPNGTEIIKVLQKIRSIWLSGVALHFLQFYEGKSIGQSLLKRALEFSPYQIKIRKLYLKSLAPESFIPKLFWFAEHKHGEWILEDPDFGENFLPWPPKFPEQ